jgi:hypothetical protein
MPDPHLPKSGFKQCFLAQFQDPAYTDRGFALNRLAIPAPEGQLDRYIGYWKTSAKSHANLGADEAIQKR